MLKLLIVAGIFVFAGLVVSNITGGRSFRVHAPDPPHAVTSSPRPSAEPSAVRVVIGGQVWTCRMEHGVGQGCTLTYSRSTRLHS